MFWFLYHWYSLNIWMCYSSSFYVKLYSLLADLFRKDSDYLSLGCFLLSRSWLANGKWFYRWIFEVEGRFSKFFRRFEENSFNERDKFIEVGSNGSIMNALKHFDIFEEPHLLIFPIHFSKSLFDSLSLHYSFGFVPIICFLLIFLRTESHCYCFQPVYSSSINSMSLLFYNFRYWLA